MGGGDRRELERVSRSENISLHSVLAEGCLWKKAPMLLSALIFSKRIKHSTFSGKCSDLK